MNKVLFSFCILFFHTIAKAEVDHNDLSLWKRVTVNANVFAARDAETHSIKIYAEIPHNFTNTLSCSLSASIKLEKQSGGFTLKTVRFQNLAAFSREIFGYYPAIPMTIKVNEGEEIAEDFHDTVVAHCSGWDSTLPIPGGFCESSKFNPGHKKICDLLTHGQKLYPWIINNEWLGSCRCE